MKLETKLQQTNQRGQNNPRDPAAAPLYWPRITRWYIYVSPHAAPSHDTVTEPALYISGDAVHYNQVMILR